MKVLFHILHPAHVHFFKNSIEILKSDGHEIRIIVRDKDITLYLLKNLNFEYEILGKKYKNKIELVAETISTIWKIFFYLRTYKPDLVISIGGLLNVIPSRLQGLKAVYFTDHEPTITNILSNPFALRIITPDCFYKDYGKKQIRYPGYHELAYLHPNRFTPDISVLNLLNVAEGEKYVIMRFVSWDATHDNGQKGFTDEMKLKAVKEFSKFAKVFITSEKKLNGELEKFRIKIPPEKIHDAINYCSLLFGESATMASEAAVLGVPAIYLDYIGRGYTDEQEKKYGLVFNFKNSIEEQEKAIKKGIELLSDSNTKSIWAEKRKKMLEEKIDVTEYIVNLIENFQKTGKI